MTLFLSFILLCSTPTVDPKVESGSISSSNASYDGSALILKGQVQLDHGLGKMEAEEATLQKQENTKDFPFSLIHLAKQVSLKLHHSGELKCQEADLDFANLQGHLTSNDRVIYTDSLKRKKGKPSSVKLLSKIVDLQFIKKSENPKSTYDIQNVIARDQVELTYAQDYTLSTDAILYQKNLVDPSNHDFQSHLSSYGKERCKLIHQADTIEAEHFDLDVVNNRLVMKKPEGVVSSFSKGEVRFTSDNLLWDHEKSTLHLKGNPSLQEPNLGTMVSDQEITLIKKEKQLVGLKSLGNTTLTYLNNHKLVSHGTLNFDRTRHNSNIESPRVKGVVPENLQLSYEEGEMKVLADQAHVEYTEEEGAFHPVSVSLKGHIKIFSHHTEKPTRFGLADRLTYSPTTRTFILGADPGKKVVFVNDEENLRISAQEVHITQDPLTKKQTVKGLGNVQFALSSEEETNLNKYFNKYAPAP